jgi:CubicO group peptidase (beta-lactamase class C family)
MRFGVVSVAIAVTFAAGCSTENDSTLPSNPPADTTTTSTVSAPSSTTSGATPSPGYDFGEVSELVDGFVTQRGLTGAGLIVVERDDGIVFEEYWGEFDAERTSLIASASKLVSAGVLMRLDDEGLLDIDAPVADVAEWGSGNPDITPAQLISNSSGLVGIYPDPVYSPYICQYLPQPILQDCGESIFTTTEDDGDVIAPDSMFRYGGGQWQVAGAVAEVASGRSWSELIDETYLQPCGLEPGSLGYSNYISEMGNGIDYPTEFTGDPSTLVVTDNPSIEAGAYATPDVFAALLLMHLRGGVCGGQQVLSQEAVDRMIIDRVADYGGSAGPGRGYGLGWWVNRATGYVNSLGAYGAAPTLNPDAGFGYYLILEANDSTLQAIDGPLRTAIESAVLSRDQ